MNKFWHWILVYLGFRPCCDNQLIVERVNTPPYYLYECLNCGNTKSGGGFDRHL